MGVRIRAYRQGDCHELAELFYETVHSVNAWDYTEEQLDAWASGEVDEAAWNQSFCSQYSLVAEADGKLVGFGDIDDTGYLDMLYIHKDYQGQKIASALCDRLEDHVPQKPILVQASITAKPFFEKRGYEVVKGQRVVRKGVELENFVMRKAVAGQVFLRG